MTDKQVHVSRLKCLGFRRVSDTTYHHFSRKLRVDVFSAHYCEWDDSRQLINAVFF